VGRGKRGVRAPGFKTSVAVKSRSRCRCTRSPHPLASPLPPTRPPAYSPRSPSTPKPTARTVELDRPDAGHEALELVHPVAQRRLGHQHQVGALDAAVLVEVRQEGDGLERLAQALRSGGWGWGWVGFGVLHAVRE